MFASLRDVRSRRVYARVHREARMQHDVVDVQVAAALYLFAQRGGAFRAHRRVGRGYVDEVRGVRDDGLHV